MADDFDEFTRQAFIREYGVDPAVATKPYKSKKQLPYTAFGLPSLQVKEVIGQDGSNTSGFVFADPKLKNQDKNPSFSQTVFVRPDPTPTTIGHEIEHLLARQNLGHPVDVRDKFKKLVGENALSPLGRDVEGSEATRKFLNNLVEVAPYIQKKYGVSNAYLDPEFIKKQGDVGLYEILATLGGLESTLGVDLTRDPELRKKLFNTSNIREAYNAVTGLRQTRTDSKDLPPYTRLPEDTGVKGALKRYFGFAEGGDVPHAGNKKLI